MDHKHRKEETEEVIKNVFNVGLTFFSLSKHKN
jgi:hypothetical protein